MAVKLTKEVLKGFVGSMLAHRFDGAVESPAFHEEAWELCCSPVRQVALAAPRRHAKTTAITFAYGMATLLFRQRKYMIIVSDTITQAEMFLGMIKNELETNKDIIDLFGIKQDEEGRTQYIKDTTTDVIVECTDGHRFRIMAKGAEQKLRGLIWNGSRPDIIICDDVENDELVLNKERRKKFRDWFYSALLPCLSKEGVIRVVGTILHMDSLLESFMPEKMQQLIRQTQKVNYLVVEELKTWLNYKRPVPWTSVRWKAHNRDMSELLWPESYTKEWFETIYMDFASQGITDKYAQEFLNTPLDEANTYFKKADFNSITASDRKANLNYYITADLAISEKETADYSVFMIAGVDENKMIHVKQILRERLDGKEIVDLMLKLQRVYEPIAMGVEEMQVSQAIGPFLREEMIRNNIFINLFPLKHNNKDKTMRSRSIQARMRAQSVKFDKEADWYQDFEDECMQFPRAKHDDQVDAFSYLGILLDYLIEAPTKEEEQEIEWEEEFGEEYEDGRSSNTGY